MHSFRWSSALARVFCLLICLALIVQTSHSFAGSSAAATTPTPTTPPQTCALYPIALHTQSLVGLLVGGTIPDVFNGTQPGNFGWLTWTGDTSDGVLATSLTVPGNSNTYINPDNPADHRISAGDWISGRPGVNNSTAVRDALNALTSIDITLPVWDTARASGSTSAYHTVAFVNVRIVSYSLVGQDKFISALFLGYNPNCGDPSPTSTPIGTATNTPTNTATRTPTRTPTPTATPTPDFGGVTCVDWTDGAAQGWIDSPWDGAQVNVRWDSHGMYATSTSSGSALAAGAYFHLPGSGPWKVRISNSTGSSFTVAQGDQPPTSAPLSDIVSLGPSGSYTISRPYIELQWMIDAPVDLAHTPIFTGVCYGVFVATATPISTATTAPTNTPTTAPTNTPSPTATPVFQFSGLNVFVGYADSLRGNPNFPVPWRGSPNTSFIGTVDPYDAGSIRIENPRDQSVAVQGVTVYFPNHNMFNGQQTFNLWGSFTIPAHTSVILTQTDYYNFDTSDYGIPGIGCDAPAGPTNNPPQITVALSDGTSATLLDTGHVLDTGGRDVAGCGLNEALPWQAIGTIGGNVPGNLVLNPPASTVSTSSSAQLVARLTDSSNQLPLSNVTVDFRVVSGPNAGVTGQGVTDSQGLATFSYTSTQTGSDTVKASVTNSIGGTFESNQVTVTWIVATLTPTPSNTPTSQPTNTPTNTPTPTPPPPALEIPGWIGSPTNQSITTNQIPIALASGVTLQSGTIDYWPADDPNAATTLATNLSGGGTLATLDTTTLPDGSYVIRLEGTDTNGVTKSSAVLITVAGEYKPGRVRFTTNDLTVPVVGVPISVGRTYDSLERNQIGDFGYGWSLSVSSMHVDVDPAHNVTLTRPDGRRVSFFFRPRSVGGIFGFLLLPSYTPEAGVYGSLTSDGCGLLVVSGGQYYCFLDTGYNPTSYTYTDPYGRIYHMDATGNLISLTDLNGDTLSFSANGITSSADSRAVAYVRDAQHRITAVQVKDSTGAVVQTYSYAYTAAGDLDTVTAPPPSAGQPSPVIQYFYDSAHPHLYKSVKDPLGQISSTSSYYSAPADPPEKDGRLKSVTDRLDAQTTFTTQYDYDLANNTVMITNPDGGHIVNHYAGHVLPQGNVTETSFQLDSQTVDVRVEGGQTKTRTTRYSYDANLNLTSIGLPDPNTGVATAPSSDPNNCAPRTICYVYDASGNRIRTTDPLGNTTITEYDANNRPTRRIDPLGNVQTLNYDEHGNFANVSDAMGLVGGYTYDDHGNPATRYLGSDPNNATNYQYDQYGNLQTEIDPLGNVTHYDGYDSLGRVGTIIETSSVGQTRVSTYTYDELGRITRATRPSADGSGTSFTMTYGYDLAGNQTLEQNEATNWQTHSTYYLNHLVKSRTQPDGTTLSYTYDWRGNPLTETDQAGHVTRYSYDLAGELIGVTKADGTANAATMTNRYDLAARKISTTDPNNHTTQLQYDNADHARFVIDPATGASHPTEYRYDADGRLVLMIDPRGVQTHYGYDARGFRSDTTYAYGTPDAATEYLGHDDRGNITTKIDLGGKITSYTYDADSRLIGVSDPLHQNTTYTVDRFGNLLGVTDAKNQHTSFSYDVLGRLVQQQWPDQSIERYSYTYQTGGPTGPMLKVSHQLADGNTNVSYLDSEGRLIRADLFDGQTSSYSYTPAGKPKEIHDARGTTCYSYDAQNRLNAIAYLGTPAGATCGQSASQAQIAYTYDGLDNRTSMTTTIGASSTHLSYAYDVNNRLCNISSGATAACGVTNSSSYDFSYDDIANTARLTYPNGVVATTTFDRLNRLKSMTQTLNGQIIASYNYTLDAAGNRTRLDEADGSVTLWAYDDDYRLTHEQHYGSSSWDTSFTYDAVGNRLTMTQTSGSTSALTSYTYRPNGLDQLASVTLPNGSTRSYSYDTRGNLLSDGVATYSYDAANRLIGASAGGHTRSYSYDALGRRIGQVADGVATSYVWDEASTYGDIVAERNSSGAVQASYIVGGDQVLAQTRGSTTSYLLYDGQGSVRTLAGSTGAVVERYTYDAFGQLQGGPSAPQSSYLYTGQQFDATTGLYNLRARSYSPADGRFLSRDTASPDLNRPNQLNRYNYTSANPINAVDPTGHSEFIEYEATLEPSEEMAEAHARYIAGVAPASGPDAEALFDASVFSAVVDEFNIALLKGLLNFPFADKITIGLGTVLHLQTNTRTKAVSLNQSKWRSFATGKKITEEALKVLIIGMLTLEGNTDVQIIENGDVTTFIGDQHAEEVIAQWAIMRYAGPPTPHRVLDIATSRSACSDRGDLSCVIIMPKLKLLNPLLFEMTIYVSWPEGVDGDPTPDPFDIFGP
jgi:RHS repeat-associated protein